MKLCRLLQAGNNRLHAEIHETIVYQQPEVRYNQGEPSGLPYVGRQGWGLGHIAGADSVLSFPVGCLRPLRVLVFTSI
jgi:hypothetical protein